MALQYGSREWEDAYQEILEKRLQKASEPYVTGSPEWVNAYEKAICEDELYRKLAAKWEGTVVLHTIAEPELDVNRDIYIFMDLWHGDCRRMRLVPPAIGETADFVISGSPTTWLRLGKGRLDTNKAVIQGKISLKGDLATLVRYSQAAKRLGQVSAKLKGRSYRMLDPQEAEELQALEKEFVEKLIDGAPQAARRFKASA
jgi:putative sterol carrier protein